MTEQAAPPAVRGRDLGRSALFAVRLTWRADRRGLVQVVLLQVVSAAGLTAVLLLVRGVLGDVFAAGTGGAAMDFGHLLPGVAVMVVLGTSGGIVQTLRTARQRVLSARVDRYVVGVVLRSAAQADLSRFELPKFHDRLQRAAFASRNELALLVSTMTTALQAGLTAAAFAAVFAAMAWWLLPFAALSALPSLRAARDERDARYGLHHDLTESHRRRDYLERLLTGLKDAKEIRALGLGRLLWTRWDTEYAREIRALATVIGTHARRRIAARLAGDTVTGLAVAGVWWLVRSHVVDIATAGTGLLGIWLLSTRVQAVTGLVSGVGESILYLQDLRTFTNMPDSWKEGSRSAEIPGPRPDEPFEVLRAEKVSFTYPGSSASVLHKVDLTLRKGEVVALVGENGSGKTTLAMILGGLYRPDTGRLVLDGVPADDPAGLRHASATLFQDFSRYGFPALDNIAFGRPETPVDADRAEEAARHAGAGAFLERLPNQYQTVLSKEFTGGVDLSGGQWQRVALARAFYRDAPFIILDEPTAALDPLEEAELFARVRDLFAGRTVLLISHRFSSVRHADRIYVLEAGHVLEEGTHESLMRDAGRYARFFDVQARPYQDRANGLVMPQRLDPETTTPQ